jgi:hypothetical protein
MINKDFARKETKYKFLNVFFIAVALVILWAYLARPCGAAPVPPEEVWTKAEHLGQQHGLDPVLIFAIACAESSLDAHADSGHARGLMQMTPNAWEEVTSRSYSEAWDWQENMEAAASYLHLLKSRLQSNDHYSWPVLAAAYHYGLGKIEQSRYDLSLLPPSRNLIYADMFNGRTPALPLPAPVRDIEDNPSVYQPDSTVAALDPDLNNLTPLISDSGEPIAQPQQAPQEAEIILPELVQSDVGLPDNTTDRAAPAQVSPDAKPTAHPATLPPLPELKTEPEETPEPNPPAAPPSPTDASAPTAPDDSPTPAAKAPAAND